ncbi:hypothetical protein CK203_018427 [Vitis vinifera]|uniref:Late embryogenesis abundant protein LEA-2 subgroup domain-containing protein n=1 Tax=Vitis vinifera TaxID=29760 RepID=A0A438J5Y9_VITVI|nr:hypothetical protein CK203_018427 [Vitis vinifera]
MKSSSELQPILRILSSASSSFSTVTYPCIDNMNRILIFFHTNNRPSHGLTLCLPSNILSPRLIPLVHGDRSGLSNIPSPRRGLIPLIHGNTSERRPLPSQQHPEPQADPARSRRQPRAHFFPSQQHPEPQAGPDPAHSRQQPERRVQFGPSPEHASQQHPEPPAHPEISSPQHFRRWTDPLHRPIPVCGPSRPYSHMLFRPRSPRFDVSSVTLNAAYLDMGYLLNADVTVLANFTNPNKKVHVDFSYLVVNLYYEDTLIASRAIYPFSVASRQTMFADVHMVTSQVRLPIKDSLKLTEQIQNNGIEFQLKGYFRTRSNLGSFLRYSYWLYGKCSIVVTGTS